MFCPKCQSLIVDPFHLWAESHLSYSHFFPCYQILEQQQSSCAYNLPWKCYWHVGCVFPPYKIRRQLMLEILVLESERRSFSLSHVSYHFQNKVLRFLYLTAVFARLSATGHHSWNPYKQKIACSLPVVSHVSSHGSPNFLFKFDLDLEHPPEFPLFFMDVWFYVDLDVASIYWALNE